MKKTERLEIDFYKELKLPQPMTCGLVNRILSPKGIRNLNEHGQYAYHLKDELIQIYEGKPALVVPGIYWVMDIFKIGSGLKWNHYLVVVESDSFYPVAEFCEVVDSTWIKDAIPYIKDYFAGFELEPIEITPYRAPKQRKTGWSNKR